MDWGEIDASFLYTLWLQLHILRRTIEYTCIHFLNVLYPSNPLLYHNLFGFLALLVLRGWKANFLKWFTYN